MLRVLNVAEKNDASRGITELLSHGRFKRREGFSVYNKIYEFDYLLDQRPCQMLFTSVSGHLFNLDYKGIPKGWNNYPIIDLFEAPVEKVCVQQMQPILRTLQSEARGCQVLIIWTDCDREGENIGYEIIDVCCAVNNHLKVFRARFSEITSAAVTSAVRNLAEPNRLLSEAVDCRMELDLRIGATFTRFQTLRFQRMFADKLKDRLISYGSCQFPTLGFVVERYKEHTNFIPEPFWKLVARATKDGTVTVFHWGRGRVFDQQCAETLQLWCNERPNATVESVSKKRKTRWRPLALDTVEMEKLCSRKLRMSVKEVMRVAEKLYNKGYISYPRTETNFFPKDFDLTGLVQMQVSDGCWGEFASRLLQEGITPRNGTKTDNAHPPIHPIRYAAPQELEGNDKRVYEYVVRHFLACLSKDAEGFETTVRVDINGEKFFTSGLVIVARNYLDVYCYEKWNATEIPPYDQGEQFVAKVDVEQGNSTAPPLLTEADLVALMEKHGIGTDATHSEHIETIKQRLYVGLINEGRFVPGFLGLGLVEGYESFGVGLSKPKLRAALEADLKTICEGRGDRCATITNQIRIYKDIFQRVTAAAQKLDLAMVKYFGTPSTTDMSGTMVRTVCFKCPSCSAFMMLKCTQQRGKYYVGCSSFPNCREAIWFNHAIEQAVVSDQRCQACTALDAYQVQFTFKSTYATLPRTYTGCVLCDEQLHMWLDVTIPDSYRCQRHPTVVTCSSGGTSSMTTTTTTVAASAPHGRALRSEENLDEFSTGSSATVTASTSSSVRRMSQYFPQQPRNSGASSKFPSCLCGVESQKLQCKRGTNSGREFFKCAARTCSFFKWCDEAEAADVSTEPQRRQQLTISNDNPIVCNCGLESPCLTVKKEGPNKGRMFYVCPKRGDDRCRFFMWADRPPSSASGSQDENRLSLAPSGPRIPIRTDIDPVRRYPSSFTSALRVASGGIGGGVHVVGMFPADVRPNNFGNGNKLRLKRRSADFGSTDAGAGTSRQRKCGLCRQAGHTARICPNKFLD